MGEEEEEDGPPRCPRAPRVESVAVGALGLRDRVAVRSDDGGVWEIGRVVELALLDDDMSRARVTLQRDGGSLRVFERALDAEVAVTKDCARCRRA